jgi:glycosyltransferase involved in cell wall biosynthesis
MACGTPAVTSNVSSLPEVAGVGAFLVSPDNEGQIAYAVDQILSVPAIREQMREAGLEQAARFSWEKTARDTAQVYLSVFKGER